MRRWNFSKEMRVLCVILSIATIAKTGFLETKITGKDNLMTKSMRNYLKEKYNGTKLKICYNDFLKKMAKFQEIEKNNEWQPYLPYGVHIQFQASSGYTDAAKDLKKRFDKDVDEQVRKAIKKYKPKTLGVGCGAHLKTKLPACYMYLGIKADTCSIKI
ncbi:unnamed protein product [Cylicocyclus nassatus]|uniref:Uncharacterized protein n=1 Tax=Cylicocyclus nassatus TaxID=53992 RepID=A0AA36DQ61_CYLNA|nr:unnamed protein product [Cylicocyclus nassatus]